MSHWSIKYITMATSDKNRQMGDEEEHQVVQPAQVQAPVIQMAQSVAIQPMPVFHIEAEVGASLATR